MTPMQAQDLKRSAITLGKALGVMMPPPTEFSAGHEDLNKAIEKSLATADRIAELVKSAKVTTKEDRLKVANEELRKESGVYEDGSSWKDHLADLKTWNKVKAALLRTVSKSEIATGL